MHELVLAVAQSNGAYACEAFIWDSIRCSAMGFVPSPFLVLRKEKKARQALSFFSSAFWAASLVATAALFAASAAVRAASLVSAVAFMAASAVLCSARFAARSAL
jgi:hypothetical protein